MSINNNNNNNNNNRHPNLTSEEIDIYFSSLNNIIEKDDNQNPKAIVLTEDFNARSLFFWENDADSIESCVLSDLSVSNNLETACQ